MTIRVRHLVALCVAFAALVLPAAAQADPDSVVRDCAADGSVDQKHSDADKRAALDRLPADLDEYSDCRAVIGASIGGSPKAGASGNHRGAHEAGGSAATKAARAKKRKAQAERRAKKRKTTELALGSRKIDPRNPDVFEASDTSNGLSTPVLLALIALGLLGAAALTMALARRNQGLAAMLRRVPLPFTRR